MSRRDHRAAHRRANELARQRGFRNAYEQRKYARRPSTAVEYLSLPEGARERRIRAVEIVDTARREKVPPELVAARLGEPMSSVRWWTGEMLGTTTRGETAITRRDVMRIRPVVFEDTERVEFVAVRGRYRKDAERIFDIQWRAAHGLATDDEIGWLKGRRIAGRPIAASQELLHEVARRGEIDPVPEYKGLV